MKLAGAVNRGYRDVLEFLKPARLIFISASLSVALSFLTVEVFAKFLGDELPGYTWYFHPDQYEEAALAPGNDFWPVLCLVILGLLGAVTIFVIFNAVIGAFQKRRRTELLCKVIISYLSLMFVFGAIYYVMVFFGDYYDAIQKYTGYYEENLLVERSQIKHMRAVVDIRVFRGMDNRLWSGVDWPLASGRAYEELDSDRRIQAMADVAVRNDTRIANVVRFLPEARLPVFADCMHFSIETMTTLGFGDISPRSWYAKLAADLEALSAVSLVVIALGMVFGNWWQSVGTDQ